MSRRETITRTIDRVSAVTVVTFGAFACNAGWLPTDISIAQDREAPDDGCPAVIDSYKPAGADNTFAVQRAAIGHREKLVAHMANSITISCVPINEGLQVREYVCDGSYRTEYLRVGADADAVELGAVIAYPSRILPELRVC